MALAFNESGWRERRIYVGFRNIPAAASAGWLLTFQKESDNKKEKTSMGGSATTASTYCSRVIPLQKEANRNTPKASEKPRRENKCDRFLHVKHQLRRYLCGCSGSRMRVLCRLCRKQARHADRSIKDTHTHTNT